MNTLESISKIIINAQSKEILQYAKEYAKEYMETRGFKKSFRRSVIRSIQEHLDSANIDDLISRRSSKKLYEKMQRNIEKMLGL